MDIISGSGGQRFVTSSRIMQKRRKRKQSPSSPRIRPTRLTSPSAYGADKMRAAAGARTVHYVPSKPDNVEEQKAIVSRPSRKSQTS